MNNPTRPADETPELSDAEIISQTLGGDTARFELIIRRHNTRLYRTGMVFLQNEEDVQDAMQNCYLKAFEKLHSFRHQATFATWITQIMINECRMTLRKRRIGEDMPEMATDPQQISNLANKEMKELLEQAILQLPESNRAVYIFRELEHYSTQDTAQLLSITPQNVKVRLHRSKEMLRENLFTMVGKDELLAFYRPKCDVLTARVMHQIFQIV